MAGELMQPPRPIVVCVDDDAAMLATVARVLRSEPVEVRTTLSASEALRWISSEQVAVLVSDYEMPEMTGAQLAGHTRQVRPETVRILLTGRGSLATAIDGLHRGEIFRFLTKPFDITELREAVQAAVVRHNELIGTHDDRKRRARRDAIVAELEAEYPGISHVPRRGDGIHVVTTNPWRVAAELGIVGLRVDLERK
jgi:DNA-binding NtrC family response regulator